MTDTTPNTPDQRIDDLLHDFAKRIETIPRGKTYNWEGEKSALRAIIDEMMGEVLGEQLEAITRYTSTHRQVGHTTAMLIGANHTQALVVVGNPVQAKYVKGGGKPILLSQLHTLKGYNSPLVVDHYALERLVTDQRQRIPQILDKYFKGGK